MSNYSYILGINSPSCWTFFKWLLKSIWQIFVDDIFLGGLLLALLRNYIFQGPRGNLCYQYWIWFDYMIDIHHCYYFINLYLGFFIAFLGHLLSHSYINYLYFLIILIGSPTFSTKALFWIQYVCHYL